MRPLRPSLFPQPHPRNARFWAGKTVGLLGGSFNPAHEGHRLIAERALKELNPDCLWWMVSPQNPLKQKPKGDDFAKRLASTRPFANHPHMLVTDIEKLLGSRYSYETIQALQTLFPKTRFIWIAGLDNAYLFDRWDQWRQLAASLPFVFYNRPQNAGSVRNTKLFMHHRLRHNTRRVLYGPTKDISSTMLRIWQEREKKV